VTKRVAGVEAASSLPDAQRPPAHDIQHDPALVMKAGTTWPPPCPGEAFGRHFLRCFFCRIGDRYTEDHFCEEGRELIVALLDELVEA